MRLTLKNDDTERYLQRWLEGGDHGIDINDDMFVERENFSGENLMSHTSIPANSYVTQPLTDHQNFFLFLPMSTKT